MRNYFFKCFLFFLPLLWISCDSNDPEPENTGQFEGGVFVANEGNYGEGDGSLSFINAEGTVTNNLFSSVNDKLLGDVVQSIHIGDNDLLYTVVNNSSKVEAASIDSLKLKFTIENVSLPRYMTSLDGKGYLTEWVSFTDPGQVTIFDLETGSIEKSITTDFGAEGVIISGSKLFVSNNFSTTVSIVDLNAEEKTGDIQAGNSPSQMVLDADGDVWVVCAGGSDANYNPLNDGKLIEIDPESEAVKKEIELNTNLSGKIAINAAGTTIFYLIGNSIYTIETTATAPPESSWVTESEAVSFYGIGVGPDDKVYAADAKGFAENGEVFQYSTTGNLETTYKVGRGPNGFAFN